MGFDVQQLLAKFEHVPTAVHQFDEKHQQVISILKQTALDLADVLPDGQVIHDVILLLSQAGHVAHEALDAIPPAVPAVKVGGQVVSGDVHAPEPAAPPEVSPPTEPAVPPAPVPDTPEPVAPSPPAA